MWQKINANKYTYNCNRVPEEIKILLLNEIKYSNIIELDKSHKNMNKITSQVRMHIGNIKKIKTIQY